MRSPLKIPKPEGILSGYCHWLDPRVRHSCWEWNMGGLTKWNADKWIPQGMTFELNWKLNLILPQHGRKSPSVLGALQVQVRKAKLEGRRGGFKDHWGSVSHGEPCPILTSREASLGCGKLLRVFKQGSKINTLHFNKDRLEDPEISYVSQLVILMTKYLSKTTTRRKSLF